MELFSLQFLGFLGVLLVAYYAVGKIAPKLQWTVLLCASVVFYLVAGSWQTLLLMMAMAAITFLGGRVFARMDAQFGEARKATRDRKERKALKERHTRRKRIVFWSLLAACFVILGYFKYWNVLLFNFGLAMDTHSLGIILPLGISFYTFQSVGYLIETYNGKYSPAKNYLHYFLFVSYFPAIIQGPINRYEQMNPQLIAPHAPDWDGMRRGFLRLGLGLLKKLAIANVLTGPVQTILDDIHPGISGSLVLYGVFLYCLQIYGDFSGGIDIVEGVSELMGIQMADNFRQPYFSTSLADFWRRWHMSLGAFMRDYVFYPLAVTKPMRRFGKWTREKLGKEASRTIPAGISNVIVFVLVGLWHGAELHYVAWGLYNGFIIAMSDLLGPTWDRLSERVGLRRTALPWRLWCILRTFVIVLIGRYFDYIASVSDSLVALRNTFFNFMPIPMEQALLDAGAWWVEYFCLPPATIAAVVLVFAIDFLYERGTDVRGALLARPFVLRLCVYVLFAVVIGLALGFDTTSGGGRFLYANF